MENGHNVNTSSTGRMPVNQNQVSDQDALYRRLKNRERQRRYRARQRLLSDLKKAQATDLSIPPQRNVSTNDTPKEHVTRVHCQRDWKKDARIAHILREEEIRSQATTFSGGLSIDAPLHSGSSSSALSVDDSETRKHIPSRRHWKADARNKKS